MTFAYLLPTILFYLFAIFSVFVCFKRGDPIDKKISVASMCAIVATTLSQDIDFNPMTPVKFLIIDTILLAFVFYCSIKSSKFWPLTLCAALVVGIFTHIAAISILKIPTIPYLAAINIWGFVCMATIIGGVVIEKDTDQPA
ncbi:MAG: hypothetical protein ACK41P_07785 [Asticcacaulis sp.]